MELYLLASGIGIVFLGLICLYLSFKMPGLILIYIVFIAFSVYIYMAIFSLYDNIKENSQHGLLVNEPSDEIIEVMENADKVRSI